MALAEHDHVIQASEYTGYTLKCTIRWVHPKHCREHVENLEQCARHLQYARKTLLCQRTIVLGSANTGRTHQ